MTTTRAQNLIGAVLIGALVLATTVAHAADSSTSLGAGPLPSWNDGKAKPSVIDFVPWVEQAYGIPLEQVVGSTIKTKFEMRDGKPVIRRLAEIDFIDDKEGKPVAINKFIGRRPIFVFGYSDGDHEMLLWTAAGSGARFMGLVYHTDAEREWAYDRKSSIGRLDKALDDARAKGWTVMDMKKDWKRVFGFE
jgi:hypothetical protein